MKKKTAQPVSNKVLDKIKKGIIFLVFPAVILVSFFVVQPLFEKITAAFENYSHQIENTLLEKTGTTFSYKTISPSVFNRVNILNVTFFSAKTGTPLLKIKKITLDYDAKKFLSPNITRAFSGLTVYGVSAGLDFSAADTNNDHREIVEKVTALVQSLTSGSGGGMKLPFAVRLKKIKIQIKLDQNEYTVSLNSLNVKKDTPGFFAAKLTGSFDVKSDNESLFMIKTGAVQEILSEYFDAVSGKFVFSGLISEDFKKSSFRLTFKNSGSTLVKFVSLNLFGEYHNKQFRVYSISPYMPFKMIARVSNPPDTDDAATADTGAVISMNFDIEKGKILSGLSFRRRSQNELYKLRNTIFSGKAAASYSVKNKTLDYQVSGETVLAESYAKFAGSDLTAAFDFEGNLEAVNIKKFTVDAQKIDFDTSLNVTFAMQKIIGSADLHHLTLPSGEELRAGMRFVDRIDNRNNRRTDGFALLIPTLAFGEQKLSDIAVDFSPHDAGMNFTAAVYDYSQDAPAQMQTATVIDAVLNTASDERVSGENAARENAAASDNAIQNNESGETPEAAQSVIGISGRINYTPEIKVAANVTTDALHAASIVNIAKTLLSEKNAATLAAVITEKQSQNRLVDMDIDIDLGVGSAGAIGIDYEAKNITIFNSEDPEELFALKAHGNASALTIEQIEILYQKHFLQGTADVHFPSKGNSTFSSNFIIDTNPYNFNGKIIANQSVVIEGSYGTFFELFFSQNGKILSRKNWSGSFVTQALPIPLGENFSYLTTSATFAAFEKTGFEAQVNAFEYMLVNSISNPTVSFSAEIKNNAGTLKNLLFKDTVSTLRGTGECSVRNIIENDIFSGIETIFFNVQLANGTGANAESYYLQAFVENAEQLPFSMKTFTESFPIEAALHAYNVPASHFLLNQQKDDKSTLHATFSGTVAKPHISLSVPSVLFKFSDDMQVSAMGTFLFDEKRIISRNAEFTVGNHRLSGISVDFALDTFTGTTKAVYRFNMPETGSKRKTRSAQAGYIETPIAIEIQSNSAAKTSGFKLPQEFAASISSSGITTHSAGKRESVTGSGFDFRIVRKYKEGFVFFTAKTTSVNGWILESGVFSLTLSGLSPIQCKADGIIRSGNLSVGIRELYVDVSKFAPFLYFPYFAVYKGIVTGNMRIDGTPSEPIFSGELYANAAEFNSPIYVSDHFFPQTEVVAVIEKNQLIITDAPFHTKSDIFLFSMELSLEGWKVENLDLQFFIAPEHSFTATINWDEMLISAKTSGSLFINVHSKFTTITGDLFCKDGVAEMLSIKDTTYASTGDNFAVFLDVMIGNKVQFRYNPFLRVLVTPNTPLKITADMSAQIVEIVGNISFRGGEIVWMGRNFYVREGRLVFDNYQGRVDPRVTVRAETKERDATGERVQIILSVQNQFLSAFMPVYSSSPPKSEVEIMQILGQIATGDSLDIGDAIAGSADFATQIFLSRRFEDGLRDLLKLDILSMRMLVMQNVLKKAFDPTSDTLTMGKFFDNTSLYMGKYLGSSIYADVLLNLAYDDTAAERNDGSLTDLKFQPEVGLEMLAPFATIRWSLAPDVFDEEASWMNAASLTLSWKIDLK
ncbi:MAG: hypothetical protein Ta2A_22350 [Treponemataceae bacterium]|nr:MAG: hypothetical protein Ta2A_22350 [Treponemataceae bacterium]